MISYKNGLISVIMPCFNSASHIEKTIESVLGQSEDNFELIAINDGSNDNTLEILTHMKTLDPRLKVFDKTNEGAGPARNYGLRHATGEFIAFLDSDDFWDNDFLRIMKKGIKESDAALVYCGWQNLGIDGGRGKPFIPPDYENNQKYETFLSGCRWPIHAALTRHSTIDLVGGFDNSLTSCMDYDLWLKIATSHRIKLIPMVLAFYQHHEGVQITKNKQRIAFNHWKVQQNFIKQHPEIVNILGKNKIRELTLGELLKRGYECYWKRDLQSARSIFRSVMKNGYGSIRDWKYMLMSFLPYTLHKYMIDKWSRHH